MARLHARGLLWSSYVLGGDMVRSKRPRSYRSGVGPAVLAQTLLPVVASVSVAQAAIDREEFRFVLWIIAGAVVVGTSFALCL